MISSDRCGESFLNRPSASANTIEQGTWIYTNFSCPLGYGHCSITKGKEMVASSIIGLLNFGGPLAVLRRVWTIIVNALNRMFRNRFWSHIGIKDGKVIPSWVNGDTTLTIEIVGRAVGVVASLAYLLPCAVFWSLYHAMRGSQLCCYLLAQAATTLSATCMEAITYHDDLIPAVTLAETHNTSTSVWGAFNDDQSPISKSSPVNQPHVTSKMKAALRRAQGVVTQLAPKGSGFPRYDCVVQAV